jgi:hypothetical protein
LVHYGSFEAVFFKRMRQRYGAPPSGSRAAKALESPIHLLSVIFGQIYFPTCSNGLKDIAGWLGFKWSDQDVSGVQSIRWRDTWEQTKMALAKDQRELVSAKRLVGNALAVHIPPEPRDKLASYTSGCVPLFREADGIDIRLSSPLPQGWCQTP